MLSSPFVGPVARRIIRRRADKVDDVGRTHSRSCFHALRPEALNTTLQRKARVGLGMTLRTAWYTVAEVIRLVFLMVVIDKDNVLRVPRRDQLARLAC